MRKKASTEWTMAKLITLVLAVVVLALVIYGVSSNGFGPLIDNMKGRFDSVLILFGIKESGKVSCGDAFDQTIEGVGSGKFYPCTDSCKFVLGGGHNLLGYDTFVVDKSGVGLKGKSVFSKDSAYSYRVADSQIHRDAYKLLSNIVDEFLTEQWEEEQGEENVILDLDKERKKFGNTMRFEGGKTLIFEIDGWWGNTYYNYNGYSWQKGNPVDDNKFEGEEVSFSDAKNALWQAYGKDEHKVTWGYLGEGQPRFPVSGSNPEYYEIKYSKGEILEWVNLLEKMKESGEVFNVHVGNYVYKYNNNVWTGKSNSAKEYNVFVLLSSDFSNVVHLANLNEERVYYDLYEEENKNSLPKIRTKGALVSNGVIMEYKGGYDEDMFKDWVDELESDFSIRHREQLSLKGELQKFLYDKKGKIDGQEGEFKIKDNDVYFGSYGIVLEFSGGDMFKLFYLGAGGVDLHYTQRGTKSPVSSFVSLPEDNWQEFIKINKIYEYFRLRRCGQ
jgi:hypothetical protein